MSKFTAFLVPVAAFVACMSLVSTAHAISARDRVMESVPFADSPQGREIQIQGLDLVETQMQNMGVTMARQRLDVYVWVRGESKAVRKDVRIVDSMRTPVSSPSFGNGTSGDAVLVGADSHQPGYSIYRTSFSLADGGAKKSEKFCVHLRATLAGSAMSDAAVFNYCK